MKPANNLVDFWRNVDRVDGGCWLWTQGRSKNRYGRFRFRGKAFSPHRFSWIFHYGDVPEGFGVLHHCDVPKCVNPAHLYVGTHTQNMHDMFNRGRRKQPRGERNGCSKLTEAAVLAIREEYAALRTRQVELAARYGVSQPVISAIILRKVWTHI